MSARIDYAPGEAWCVAAGRVVLVCERDLAPGRARALHVAAASIDSAAALASLLDGEPAALIGLIDLADRRALLRRHGVPAAVDSAAMPDRFGPEWALDEVPAAAAVAAGGLDALATGTLPFEGGVARVAAVRVAPRAADASTEPAGDAPVVVAQGEEARSGAFGQTLPPRVAAETPSAAKDRSGEDVADAPRLIDSIPGFIKPAVDLHELPPADAAPAHLAPVSPTQPHASAPVPATQPHDGATPSSGGDHDGMTITADQARALQAGRAAGTARPAPFQPAGPPATGPLVLSTLCERGHHNAPGSTECMLCAAPVDERSAAQRRRPEFAVAVLPSGERLPLGRGVVIGRRPRSRRVEDGRVPRLVTVESPGEDISRSHLELRVDDWNLVAVDLSSTNGTLLLRDGAAPQRLRPEASTILQLGDRLDLGDGVVVAIAPADDGACGSGSAP